MRKKQHLEKGQALVLIILAIVAIFGFAALAVDIGRVYAERRRAQNAADAAAYAAAFAATQNRNYLTAGLDSTETNGFPDGDAGLNPGARMDVRIHHPPINGRYSVATETINPMEYYQVIITSEVDKAFSQFVYQGPLVVTVEAIARGTGQTAFADGNALVATCNQCDAIRFTGTGDVLVNGGNIVSVADPDGCDAGTREGTGCLEMIGGSFNLGGLLDDGKATCGKDENGDDIPGIQGPIHEGSGDLWFRDEPQMPGCTGLPTISQGTYSNVGSAGNPYELSPGIYSNGISISGKNSSVRLNPGMYCLDGDLDVTSGSLAGAGVMFVMRGNSSVKITTSGSVTLSAPAGSSAIPDNTIYPGFKWSGFLIFMPSSNTGLVQIAGGNTSNYTGTIYAPGETGSENKYKCSISGNSDQIGLNASVICCSIDLNGTGNIDITYRDDSEAQAPPSLELTK